MHVIDYLLVDAHGDFPRYPLEHEPIKPIVNFPEISMWGLAPWGGFGANPLPERFQRLWDSMKHLVKGGLPYSEGIYEDINKVQYAGYYWEPERRWTDILAEYINYEFAAEAVEDALELMRCIEVNHTHIAEEQPPEEAVFRRAAQLARKIDARLGERARTAWRWRILYIRAMLDEKRYAHLLADTQDDPKKLLRFRFYSGDRLLEDAEAQAMFLELQRYYHCVPHNGENHHTLPPAGGTKLDVVV
jgi:phytoene dehydrogenase-like protein